MNPTRRYDNDRAWSRDEDDERHASSRYRNNDPDDTSRERYRTAADRDRGRPSSDDDRGNSGYRQQFGDSTGRQDFASRGRRPEDGGYDDHRSFQQQNRQSRYSPGPDDDGSDYQGDGQPQRGGYYSQGSGRYPGSQAGNYEPGYGHSRGYGNQGGGSGQRQGNWQDRSWQGASPGYEHERAHSWREDYGSTGQQYRSHAPIYGSQSHWDSASASDFRGQGPKGYTRSDQRIQEDVNDCLTESASLDASGIEIAVRDGEVTLSGTVNSRACKREAEDLADRISGVKHVQNNLRIAAAGATQGASKQGVSGSGAAGQASWAQGPSSQSAGSNTASHGTSGAGQTPGTAGTTGTTGKTGRTTN